MTTTGTVTPLISGLTAAIDSAPLGHGPNDPLVILEFSTNMLQGAPGRLRLMTPTGASTSIAEGLPTPTSMVVDPVTGEIFVTHIFPGFITRHHAAAILPDAAPSAIVPVVANVPGAFGDHFTTGMQLSNPYPFAISGRMVVHPAGASASPNDPSMPFSLAPFATTTVNTPITNGAGSLDVLASVGSAPIIVTTMTESTSMNRLQIPAVDPADTLTAGTRGTLITPGDPTQQRFNIGIRTLGGGATLAIHLHDSTGALVSTATRGFAPDYFLQFAFAELLGRAAGANQSVTFEVLSGSAIVYGSAVDNTSGTMSLQLPQGVHD